MAVFPESMALHNLITTGSPLRQNKARASQRGPAVQSPFWASLVLYGVFVGKEGKKENKFVYTTGSVTNVGQGH